MVEEDFLIKALNNIIQIDFEKVYNNFSSPVRENIKTEKSNIDKLYNLINKLLDNNEKVNEFIKNQFTDQIRILYQIIINIKAISEDTNKNDENKISSIVKDFNNSNSPENPPFYGKSKFDHHFNNLVLLSSSIGLFNSNKDDKDILKIYNTSKEIEESITKIFLNAKSVSAEIGVSTHSKEFKGIADEYKSSSKIWLTVTSLLGIIFILFLALIFYKYSDKTELNLNLMFLKVAFFSMLFTATIWSGNKYKILCHLYTVNLHKAKSLQTFRTFVDATDKEDKDIRNAILLECTKTIFVTPDTGYIKSEEKNSGTNIIEVMKNFKSG